MNALPEHWEPETYTHYGLPVYTIDGEEMAYAEDDEAADEAAKANILDSLWAFQSTFLSTYIPALRDLDARDAFDKMREKLCEDANSLVLAMLGDKVDAAVEEAISLDGRGHFLAGYDGDERDATDGMPGYLYRIN
ncbi:MAG: hypothetical protein H6590_06110 [Flavobacteriales bacterium]|nr:hypothetical protein [Flavobacteriales bacterium]